MDPGKLIGAWQLDEFVAVRGNGERWHPYGADAAGMLVYSTDGWVAATLARADRGEGFPGTSLETAAKADDPLKVEAFDSYTSYVGRYRIEDGEVFHDITMCLVPSAVGRTLSRAFTLEGGVLTLAYDVEGKSGSRRHELRWKRP